MLPSRHGLYPPAKTSCMLLGTAGLPLRRENATMTSAKFIWYLSRRGKASHRHLSCEVGVGRDNVGLPHTNLEHGSTRPMIV